MDRSKHNYIPNVGWYFACQEYNVFESRVFDQQLADYCKKYGNFGYSFITYPLGGVTRFFWHPNEKQEIPPIHLPDLQLDTQFWHKYINCAISRWIDLDSEKEWLAQISKKALFKEIEYANYLGITSIVIGLSHSKSPRLAEMIRKYISSPEQNINFWILLPTNSCYLDLDTVGEDEDIWEVWRNFRTLCGNSSRLYVGLIFTEDLGDEFSNYNSLKRWYAEPLNVVLIDNSIFSHQSSLLKLTEYHNRLLTSLILSQNQHILISSQACILDGCQEKSLIDSVKNMLQVNRNAYTKENLLMEYFDQLQIPLQPLSNNLTSTIYHTFEQDNPKYKNYQDAIKLALHSFLDQGRLEITLIVLGAGRGPLVIASMNAKKKLNKEGIEFDLKLYAVEKNPNAILSLEYCNERWWNNSVTIIEIDMRFLASLLNNGILDRPDIIVSELLGSFGDNELSPECLDGVNCILKNDSICIPQSYVNFIAPIQSLKMYQNVTAIQSSNKTCSSKKATDCFYVVCLNQYCYLDDPKQCFEFSHPNKDLKTNNRTAKLQFIMPSNSELVGFAGHFEAILFGNINLSTHPKRHTDELYSWFPIFFPLRKLFYFVKETPILFQIYRKIDENKCWYEWFITYQSNDGKNISSEVQNINGESQFMKLNS